MGEIKVYLPDDLDKRFRKAAMNFYGYGRGSISKAAADAFLAWCRSHETIVDNASTQEKSNPDATVENPALSKEERGPRSLTS